MILSRWLIANEFRETNFERVFRIEPNDTVILDIHARHAVSGSGHEKAIVKTHFQRTRLDLAVPIKSACAETEVPLSNNPRLIPSTVQYGGKRNAARFDDE